MSKRRAAKGAGKSELGRGRVKQGKGSEKGESGEGEGVMRGKEEQAGRKIWAERGGKDGRRRVNEG